MIGKVVSHYKILEKLGEGGMGVVYKAEDLKLTRTVALKFLPHGLNAHEPERARFLQEARAAAILNHPNICTIHDIAEAEGQQFIVMEYVEGKTLREIVPLRKMQDAITYAIQAGEGLQEAHSHGIVHRDIKAENIMVNSKNQVKVMDFGLAKLKGSLKLTKTSSTIGTLAYMAPEQIQGEEVDARSDIFSFGIVLYEMLTGHLPFRGEHEAAMVYSIVNEDPEPLQHYVQGAPSELLHILDRALEKDSEERYQSVHEMLIDLRRLRKDSSRVARHSGPSAPVPGSLGERAVVDERKRHRKKLWVSVTAVLALCVIFVVYMMLRHPNVQLNPNRTSVTLRIPFKEIGYPSMSRDGNWLAFPAKDNNGMWDVYLMNTSGGMPERVTNEHAMNMSVVDISPDVSQIAYDCFNWPPPAMKVKLVASQGGACRTVADTGGSPKWSPDGKRIGYLRAASSALRSVSGKLELWSVSQDGTDSRLEFTDSTTTSGSVAFDWSPDGASVTWVRSWPEGYAEVMVRELATGEERQLTADGKDVDEVIWARNDMIFFVSTRSGQSSLWVTPVDGGVPTRVVQGGVPILGARISADNKTVVYLQQESVGNLWVSGIDGNDPRQITFDDVIASCPAFSPDGQEISFILSSTDLMETDAHLFVMDRSGNNRRQLTFGAEQVSEASWSPDGKWLAYSGRLPGEPEDSARVNLIQPSNPGPPRVLCKGESLEWLDNESLIVYTHAKTLRYSLAGGAATQVYQDSTYAVPMRGTSQMLFRDFRKGRAGVWKVPVDSLGRDVGRASLLIPFPIQGVASSDGWGFLIYTKGEDELWRVRTSTGKSDRVGRAPFTDAAMWHVSADGKEILWVKYTSPSKLVLVKNVFE